MGEYISNKIRCKKCEHFEKTDDKNIGICKLHSYGMVHPIFVTPNKQIPICFEEKGKVKVGFNEKDTNTI